MSDKEGNNKLDVSSLKGFNQIDTPLEKGLQKDIEDTASKVALEIKGIKDLDDGIMIKMLNLLGDLFEKYSLDDKIILALKKLLDEKIYFRKQSDSSYEKIIEKIIEQSKIRYETRKILGNIYEKNKGTLPFLQTSLTFTYLTNFFLPKYPEDSIAAANVINNIYKSGVAIGEILKKELYEDFLLEANNNLVLFFKLNGYDVDRLVNEAETNGVYGEIKKTIKELSSAINGA